MGLRGTNFTTLGDSDISIFEVLFDKRTLRIHVYLLMVQKSGGNAPVEVGSLSHYLQGFIHPRW